MYCTASTIVVAFEIYIYLSIYLADQKNGYNAEDRAV